MKDQIRTIAGMLYFANRFHGSVLSDTHIHAEALAQLYAAYVKGAGLPESPEMVTMFQGFVMGYEEGRNHAGKPD